MENTKTQSAEIARSQAEKLLYRFHDHGGRDVCMRYDLTVPLAVGGISALTLAACINVLWRNRARSA